MELSPEEKIKIEKERIFAILKDSAETEDFNVEKVSTEYKERYKSDLGCFKIEFSSLNAFLKYACCINISSDGNIELPTLTEPVGNTVPGAISPTVHYVSRPQFSPFYGFSEQGKGVPYRVWRFEVDSVIRGGLYSNEVISEQIRRSLYGEAKTKLVGLGPETTCESLLLKLDQFYSDVGAATGDELLTEAYRFKQAENEEVAAFASRLDNHVRMQAKLRGTELLPDEDAVERQLRMLFWEGIKESIKDKARHRKDSCKSFSELITAARCGEKESSSNRPAKRIAHSNQVSTPTAPEPDSKPAWMAEVCSAMAREVREALKEGGGAENPQHYMYDRVRMNVDYHEEMITTSKMIMYQCAIDVVSLGISWLDAETDQVMVTGPKGFRETDGDLCPGATRDREGQLALFKRQIRCNKGTCWRGKRMCRLRRRKCRCSFTGYWKSGDIYFRVILQEALAQQSDRVYRRVSSCGWCWWSECSVYWLRFRCCTLPNERNRDCGKI